MKEVKNICVTMKQEFIDLIDERIKAEQDLYKIKTSRSEILRDAFLYYNKFVVFNKVGV